MVMVVVRLVVAVILTIKIMLLRMTMMTAGNVIGVAAEAEDEEERKNCLRRTTNMMTMTAMWVMANKRWTTWSSGTTSLLRCRRAASGVREGKGRGRGKGKADLMNGRGGGGQGGGERRTWEWGGGGEERGVVLKGARKRGELPVREEEEKME